MAGEMVAGLSAEDQPLLTHPFRLPSCPSRRLNRYEAGPRRESTSRSACRTRLCRKSGERACSAIASARILLDVGLTFQYYLHAGSEGLGVPGREVTLQRQQSVRRSK
jgi:hypothetical protein